MRELAVDTPDFAFKARLEQGKDGEHTFAQLSIRIGDVIFGDPDAWSLSGTIARLSQDLLARLQSQVTATPALRTFLAGLPAQALLDALEVRLYRTGGWAYEAEQPLGDVRAEALADECHTGALVLGHLREVMTEALDAGGTSFDSLYVNVNGESGYFERDLAAYGREGLPCRRCGSPMRREAFMNRSSFRCPRCQRPPTPGPVRR